MLFVIHYCVLFRIFTKKVIMVRTWNLIFLLPIFLFDVSDCRIIEIIDFAQLVNTFSDCFGMIYSNLSLSYHADDIELGEVLSPTVHYNLGNLPKNACNCIVSDNSYNDYCKTPCFHWTKVTLLRGINCFSDYILFPEAIPSGPYRSPGEHFPIIRQIVVNARQFFRANHFRFSPTINFGQKSYLNIITSDWKAVAVKRIYKYLYRHPESVDILFRMNPGREFSETVYLKFQSIIFIRNIPYVHMRQLETDISVRIYEQHDVSYGANFLETVHEILEMHSGKYQVLFTSQWRPSEFDSKQT